jgi:hypothetical protein
MNQTKPFFKASPVRFGLGAAVLLALSGGTGCGEGPQAVAYVAPPVVYVTPPIVEPGVAVEDNYYYYPGYGVYYNTSRRQFAYLEDGLWVSRPAPPGVALNVLLASASVRMNFHDAPAGHHAEMVKQYPRDWKSPGPDKGPKPGLKDDRRDDHAEPNGR